MSWGRPIDLLNWLAVRREAARYLEIGTDTNATFNAVTVAEKIGVDPQWGGTHRMTSRDFWIDYDGPPFDLVYLDGLHLWEETLGDVVGALARLTPQGAIVVHDVLPASEDSQARLREHLTQYAARPGGGRLWNGDCWKAAVLIRTWRDVDSATWSERYGCLVLLPRPNTAPLSWHGSPATLSWRWYEQYGPATLRVLDEDGLRAWVEAAP